MFNIQQATMHLPLEIKKTILLLDDFYFTYASRENADVGFVNYSSQHSNYTTQINDVKLTLSHISVRKYQHCLELAIDNCELSPIFCVEWNAVYAVGICKRSSTETTPHKEFSPNFATNIIYPGWLTMRLSMINTLQKVAQYL